MKERPPIHGDVAEAVYTRGGDPVSIHRAIPDPIFAAHFPGRVAEWLGTALQKLLLRFESARDLTKKCSGIIRGISILVA
jgi:hypothetical protein